MSPRPRHYFQTTVVLGLTLILASAAAAQKPHRKPPATTTTAAAAQAAQTPPPPAPASRIPPAKLARIDDRLAAYATAQARAELGDLAKEKNAQVLVALGRILEQEKAYTDADSRFREAASLAPQDPAPWAHLAFSYFHQRRGADGNKAYQEAASRAQAVLRKNSKDAEAQYYLGVASLYVDTPAAAEAHLTQARKLMPGDAMPVFQLGMTRILQQKWTDAVALFTEALQMDGDLAYAYYYRGQAASKAGKKDMLIADLKRFLELAPDAPEAPLAARTVAAASH